MSKDVDIGDGMAFSMKQVIALILIVGPMSGLGGAYTVSAQDAVQDVKIKRVEAAVENIREELSDTHDAVIVMVPQIEAIEEDINNIQDDLKEILKAVQRVEE